MACGSEGCRGRWSTVALADLDRPPDVGLPSVCESPLATVGAVLLVHAWRVRCWNRPGLWADILNVASFQRTKLEGPLGPFWG